MWHEILRLAGCFSSFRGQRRHVTRTEGAACAGQPRRSRCEVQMEQGQLQADSLLRGVEFTEQDTHSRSSRSQTLAGLTNTNTNTYRGKQAECAHSETFGGRRSWTRRGNSELCAVCERRGQGSEVRSCSPVGSALSHHGT